ncbi:hypothetical protein DITRI_Ditri05aG0046100 [Diplodiscus trichospermus]
MVRLKTHGILSFGVNLPSSVGMLVVCLAELTLLHMMLILLLSGFFSILRSLKSGDAELAVMMLWSMWCERNERLWKNTVCSPEQVVFHGKEVLFDWLQARQSPGLVPRCNSEISFCSKWHLLPASFLKCSCDTATFSETGEFGMGLVLRDETSSLVAFKMIKLPGLPQAHECEALTLLETLLWIRELGYSWVIFETDSKMVVDGLDSYFSNHTEFGAILSSCSSILLYKSYLKVVVIRRLANVAAHTLARQSCFVSSSSSGVNALNWLVAPLRAICLCSDH